MQKDTSSRIRNWIYYYKWYVVIGVLLLIFAIRYAAGLLGITGLHPDLQAAYVGCHVLSRDTVSQLEALLAEKAGDYNKDGKVIVKVHQYLTSSESGATEAQQNASAAEISLVGDINGCESYLFLLEDPEQFQIEWQILADESGNPPEASDYTVDKKVLPLTNILPDLSSIAADGDREVLSSLLAARRCFFTEKLVENAKDLAFLWNRMTGSTSLPAYAGGTVDNSDSLSETGSGGASPEAASSGSASSRDIDTPLPEADENGKFIVGNTISAPYRFSGLTLNEYNEALAANGFYYATWIIGEPSSITNSDGENALLYPLQLYMVTYEGTDPADAGSKASGWLAAARKNYTITSERTFSAAGREYTLLEYIFTDASSPFVQGASAFLTSEGETAVCAELLSVEDKGNFLRETLESFLLSLGF